MNTHTDTARREALGQRVDHATERLCRLGISNAPAADIEAAKDALRAAVRDWNDAEYRAHRLDAEIGKGGNP